MTTDAILTYARARWDGLTGETEGRVLELRCRRAQIAEVCGWLFEERGCAFAGLFVEEGAQEWELRYAFVSADAGRQVNVRVAAPLAERTFPSASARVHAADWHEREAEDMFGLVFEGHPRLGDFILHDDVWQEGVEPMRRAFDPERAIAERRPREDWRPRRVVEAPGVFVMPVGPVYSGEAESVSFQLETIGEEIIRAFPRLFFKYRAVEKMAEGRAPDGALLLAERFAGTTAFAHALAFCGAVEQIAGIEPPERAQVLRVFLAELERFRHHLGRHRGHLQLDRSGGRGEPDGHSGGGGPARLVRAGRPPLPLRPRRAGRPEPRHRSGCLRCCVQGRRRHRNAHGRPRADAVPHEQLPGPDRGGRRHQRGAGAGERPGRPGGAWQRPGGRPAPRAALRGLRALRVRGAARERGRRLRPPARALR